MNHRTHRLRRVAAAIALGVGGVGSVVGLAAGTAAAATKGTIKATSAPSIGATGTGLAAGSLTLTLPAGVTVPATTALTLTLDTATGAHHVHWNSATVTHSAGTATITPAVVPGTYATTSTTMTVLVKKASATADTIRVTGITYDTTHASGTISVTPTGGGVKWSPTSVVNAKAPGAPTPFFGTHTLTATATLPLAPTGNGQAAGTWTIHLAGTKTEGWTATKTVDITLDVPGLGHTADNCTVAGGYVVFTGTPSVKVATSSETSTTPTVSDSTLAASPCTGANHNELAVKFTNSGTLTGTSGSITLAISGVKYDVGNATLGPVYVTVSGAFSQGPSSTGAPNGPSNGTVTTAYVTANTPPVSVKPNGYAQTISPVKLVENAPTTVQAGYVCMDMTAGAINPLGNATAKALKGDGVVTSKVTYQKSTGAAATTTTTAKFARFLVKTASTTTATTYAVTGLAVNAPGTAQRVFVTVWRATGTDCATTPHAQSFGNTIAYSVGQGSNQIYGATADATAAAEFSTTFPHTGTAGSCPTGGVAVLATDEHFPDALSSSYLAGSLTTGTLLTPTAKLASATLNELRVEGIKQVDVVGGSLAVSTTVVAQLETTPVYQCGGKALATTGGRQQYITVDRIAGYTQYGTAEQVAKYVGTAPTMDIAGAYLGTNAAKGTGKFNDTPATGSPTPNFAGPLKTAILASGQEFQDAESASVLAYRTGLPIILTPATSLATTAITAIHSLGIQQVVLMGGTLAVTNTVAKKVETTLGVSVVRVAGKDATDTAVQLAGFECAATGTGANWTPDHGIMVARGNGYTDGLAGAVVDAYHAWPLLLTENPTTVGTYLTTFLKMAGKTGIDGNPARTISTLTILGGPLAITPATIAQMQTDLQH